MINLQIVVTLALLSILFQISSGQKDLQITNVTSPTSAQLLVTWNSSSTLVSFFVLDLRVVNNATITPITTIVSVSIRSKLMQGLRTGTYYNVTLKSYGSSSNLLATTWVQSQTVPATPQITSSSGISSSVITVGWSSQVGADNYFLMVTLGTGSINRTFTALNCSIAGLQPSSLYSLTVYAVNSAGPSAASKRVTALTLTPPPMDVTVIPISSYSATLTWTSVEKALMYGIFVYENGPTPNLAFIRKTTSIMITLDNLLPCTKYIFALTSYNWFYTSGEENWVLHETGMLNSPQIVNIQYSSNLGTALLSWNSSVGASSYTASAKTQTGQESLCTSTSTSCQISNLPCEQDYVVSITALTSSCSSNSSQPLNLVTAACAPQNITVSRDCHINTISMYWNPVTNAVKYTASAIAPDGTKEECVNRDTYCFFMNLPCGTVYEMSVFAFDGKLNGSSSPAFRVRTAPCDPENVQAIAHCEDNTLAVSWDPSVGAVFYTAYALGSSGATYNCSTGSISCQITELQCGESLSVSLVAYDNECPSMNSDPVEIATAPCPPKHVSAVTDCKTHSTVIQWSYSEGAVLYVAHVQATNGSEYSCESFDLSCSLSELPCSLTYTVFVTASNYQCMSPYSPTLSINTVPCIPKNIAADVICDQNAIHVTWAEDMANITFTATAQSDSDYFNCTTHENNCEISNISCGQLYSISVDADNGQCIASSNQIGPQYLVPCKPTDVFSKHICVNDSAEISWTKSSGFGINMYVAAMQSNDGTDLMCQSMTGTCVIGGTKCGEVYKATVTAVGINCQTLSNEFYVDPEPCSPSNLDTHVSTGLVVASWTAMAGALNYTTDITGVSGEKHECYTANTSCSITELMCDHQYNMAVTANGRYCSSSVSDTQTFQTAPCAPQNVTVEVDCVTNTAAVSWISNLGAENYTSVAVGTDGKQHVCQSTAPSCDIAGLLCGQLYLITVSAANNISISERSLPVELHTAPCLPVQEPPQLHCYNNSISLSWSTTSGAVSYMSNATSLGEETLSCHTEDTGCTINELKCGQIYTVTVTAINKHCWGPTSAPSTLITAPCQPQNVVPKMNCSNSAAQVSWDKALGALSYFSVLRTAEKHYVVCNSTELGCEISALPCGQTYDVIVTAVNDQCESAPSFPVELYTVPCTPSEVQADISCESNIVTVAWSKTPGAVDYILVANGSNGEQYYCQTTNTSCSYTTLACGLEFEASIAAVGNTCRSDDSAAIAFHTVPCVASNINVQLQCGNDYAEISWMPALGGTTYIASVSTLDGDESKCNTSEASCIVNHLQCGQTYAVTVETFGAICSSIAKAPEYVHTGPCVPQDIAADVDCQLNSAVVSWSSTLGSVNYTALLSTSEGEERTCHSTSTSCNLTSLSCSATFHVIVRAFNDWCQTDSSHEIQLITAPCAPDHVHTALDCSTNSLAVSWNQVIATESFTSYLIAPDGGSRTCNTGQSNCTFPNLPCGYDFIVTVSAANSRCGGPMSQAVNISTAPCVPMSVNTALDCITNSALISWSLSRGALSYMPSLIGSQGERYNCSSQNTSCWMRNVPCGESNTVGMMAQNDICMSIEHTVAVLHTCPCAPQNLSIFYPCDSNVVKLQWTSSPGSVHYKSSVISSHGEIYTCNTTDITCDIGGLQCGEIYNVTVTAFNDQQANVSLKEVTFQTAPCIPTNVRAELHCGTRIGTLRWETAQGATTYSALVTGINGWSGMCTSGNTTCDISDLECGQVYTVTITASNSHCNSIGSPTDIYTVPCVPQNVRPVVMCGTNITEVSWDRTPGAFNYTAIVIGTKGEVHSCSTAEATCNIEALDCGQAYYVTVTAYGEQCKTESTTVEFHTGPCVPQILNTMPACAVDSFTLSWAAVLGADYYVGKLTNKNGKSVTCNTTDQSCNIRGTECGEAYTVTIEAHNDQCSSKVNSSFLLYTAPCVPTNLTSSVTCETQYLTVSWDEAPGSITYTVTAHSAQDETSFKTQNTSYEFKDLLCDEEYEVIISSESATCSSLGNSSLRVRTIPCAPNILEAYAACENNSGIIHWDFSHNARSYMAIVEGVNRLSCNTTDTACEIPKLECGQNYTATVWAEDGTCTGQNSTKLTFKTVPCVVQNVTSTVMCQENTLHVSWIVSSGATAYFATAVGSQGDVVTADTTEANLLLSPLQCGAVYSLTVLAINDECKSPESAAVEVISAPCSPMHLTASAECDINGASATWELSAGAVSYIAVFLGPDGDEVSCTSLSTSCSVSGLHCGQAYNVTVTAFDGSCNSITTKATIVTTGPCVPQILNTMPACAVDSFTLSWATVLGADYYVGKLTNKNGKSVTCNTTDQSCNIRGTECGEAYTVTIEAHNDQCSSKVNSSFLLYTAPCVPTNLTSSVTCETQYLTVSWDEAPGSITYTVTAHSAQDETSFKTQNTSYEFKDLLCDEEYEVIISSESATCSSLGNSSLRVRTIPCAPNILAAYAACENNSGIIHWDFSHNARSYMAIVEGVNRLSCNTTDTACEIPKLECGQNYTATVWAEDGTCTGQNSTKLTFKTVPCVVQNVTSTVMCQENTLHVSWIVSSGATAYFATAVGSQGDVVTADTTEANLLLSPLQCGAVYSLTILAINDECKSPESAAVEVISAPCSPMHLTASAECDINGASATWELSAGAVSYIAVFLGPDGDEVSCTSLSTSCSVSGLHCGQAYNVTVTAFDGSCNSITTKATIVTTVPCAPINVAYTRNCPTTMASVTWSASEGAIGYHLTATESGGAQLFCNSTNNTCWLMDLNCGLSYLVEVVAIGQKCSSNTSSSVLLDTAPCLPNNTAVHMDCEANSAILSWEGSRGALGYIALVKKDEDFVHSCDTEDTNCTVPGLSCGTSYSFSVLAMDLQCNSSFTTPIVSGVVPCPPNEVETLIYHGSVKPQEVEVSWNGSHCGTDYMATVQGQIGNDPESSFTLNSYWTSYMDFYIPVPCSASYNVTVTAQNSAGASVPSTPIAGYTAPCSPQVKPLVANEGSIIISWEATPYADEYRVLEIGNSNVICTTTGLSCQVPFTSSSFQVIAVNPSGESTPAFLSGYNSVSSP